MFERAMGFRPKIHTPLFAILLLMLVSPTVNAQQSSSALFTPVESARAVPEGMQRAAFVRADVQQLTNVVGQATTLHLFNDVAVRATLAERTQNPSGSVTWIGRIADGGQAILVVRGDAIYGSIDIPSVGEINVAPIGDGLHIIQQPTVNATLAGTNDFRIASPDTAFIAPDLHRVADDGALIDVYVAYDNDASGGEVSAADAQSYAELFIAYTNLAYANSGITQRVWLVGAVEGYPYTDTNSGSLNADLDNLTPGGAGTDIAGLLAKRNEYHADLVVFFVPLVGGSCSGLAWLQTSNGDLEFEDNGYSVMEGCSYGEGVFAHELGHNMGGRHDWYVDDNSSTPYPYAHGHVDTINAFRTIMSYSNRCSALGGTCPRIPHFANPAVTYNGAPTGVSVAGPVNCTEVSQPVANCAADMATTFNNKAAITSQFRSSQLTWKGGGSTDWNDANNWEIAEGAPGATTLVNRVPRTFDDVFIPNGAIPYPTISSGTRNVRGLEIESGATLTMNGGTLNVSHQWLAQGTFNGAGGTVVFGGALDQTITVSANSTFNNVTIGSNSTNRVSLASDLDVNGNLTIAAGAQLLAENYTVHVAGDWTEEAADGFVAGTSTVTYDGATQAVNKATTVTTYSENMSNADGQGSCNTAYNPDGWTQPAFIMYGCERQVNGNTSGAVVFADSGWVYTPQITLNAGIAYNLSFDVDLGNGASLMVYYGTSADTSTANLIGSATNNSTSLDFTVPADGSYYLRLSYTHAGSWTDMDNFVVAGAKGLEFYNVQFASGVTTLNEDVAVLNDLTTTSGRANFDTNDVTVEGDVTNGIGGGLQQTKNVPNGVTTSILSIKNAAGSADKYYGVEITPSGAMGNTSLIVYPQTACSTSNATVQRCFEIDPTTSQTAQIRFYYEDSEVNGNSTPQVWHNVSGTIWEMETFVARGGSEDSLWVTASGIDNYSPFALYSETPTAVGLATADANVPILLLPLILLVSGLMTIVFWRRGNE